MRDDETHNLLTEFEECAPVTAGLTHIAPGSTEEVVIMRHSKIWMVCMVMVMLMLF